MVGVTSGQQLTYCISWRSGLKTAGSQAYVPRLTESCRVATQQSWACCCIFTLSELRQRLKSHPNFTNNPDSRMQTLKCCNGYSRDRKNQTSAPLAAPLYHSRPRLEANRDPCLKPARPTHYIFPILSSTQPDMVVSQNTGNPNMDPKTI